MTRYDLFLISSNEYDYRLDVNFKQLKALIANNDIDIKEFIEDNASLHYRGLSKGSIQLIGYFDDNPGQLLLPIARAGEDKVNGIILLNMNLNVPNGLPSSTHLVGIQEIANKINRCTEYFNDIINKLKTKENE